MKQGQETNQIWTQEAGTDDTHNRTLTICTQFGLNESTVKLYLLYRLYNNTIH